MQAYMPADEHVDGVNTACELPAPPPTSETSAPPISQSAFRFICLSAVFSLRPEQMFLCDVSPVFSFASRDSEWVLRVA